MGDRFEPRMAQKFGAEFVGTFMLVYAATGSIVINAQTSALGLVGIALVHFFVIAGVIYSIEHVSGSHINPAVSLGMWLARRINLDELALYIGAQVLGATVGSWLVLNSLGSEMSLGATMPVNGDVGRAFVLEVILTFFLIFVVLGSTDGRAFGSFAGLAIGGAMALDVLIGAQISGASMNPARSLGPAIVSGNLSFLWAYWTAPFLGAVLAVAAYHLIKIKKID